jgi:Fic family protein
MERTSGTFRKNLRGDSAYLSFLPKPLPPEPKIETDNEILNLIVKASKQLALLNGMAERIPNVNLFISMYVRKEALMSSQIEGTQATLEDILDPLIEKNANRNVAEVVNYIKAIEFAIKKLKKLPICNRLIKETHAVLMNETRGGHKEPGEYRNSQNWIGGIGSSLKTARYIPPNKEDMLKAMADLESYINNPDEQDALIKVALIHYQFETIHPFLDGNGRVGRLLILLYLLEQRVLSTPVLYISYFLKKNRIEYYDRLMEVRKGGNFEQWVKFFLQAVYETASETIADIDMLVILHSKNVSKIENLGKASKTALNLFSYLEKNPIIDIQKTAKDLNTTFKTMANAVSKLASLKILFQTEGKQRNRLFAYKDYLNILKKGC